MNNLTLWRDKFKNAKAMSPMQHDGRSGSLFTTLPATELNYKNKIGNGLKSSVIAAPVNWVMRTFPEAPPMVEKAKENEWHEQINHDMVRLLKRPNPYYSGLALWMATALDFTFGEAYWLKIRNKYGKVVQLWWTPRLSMTPKWPQDGSEFISHYEYRPNGQTFDIHPDDVVHFRFGMDPENPRRGLSQLAALAREIYTDDLAANFSASILNNLGVIGVVVSPKAGIGTKEDVQDVKDYIQSHFTGDKRGQAMALRGPTDVQLLQYNMEGFDVSPIRDLSEERVCAALGIPAAVVGFGTGLQQTKVGATMRELRQLAWTGCLIPMQTIIADEISRALLPDFEEDQTDFQVRFDTSKVSALWEDRNQKHDRVRKDAMARIITLGEARGEMGYPVKPEHDVYIQQSNVVVVSPSGEIISAAGGTAKDSEGGLDDTTE